MSATNVTRAGLRGTLAPRAEGIYGAAYAAAIQEAVRQQKPALTAQLDASVFADTVMRTYEKGWWEGIEAALAAILGRRAPDVELDGRMAWIDLAFSRIAETRSDLHIVNGYVGEGDWQSTLRVPVDAESPEEAAAIVRAQLLALTDAPFHVTTVMDAPDALVDAPVAVESGENA